MTLLHPRPRYVLIVVLCLLSGIALAASQQARAPQAAAVKTAARVPIAFASPHGYAAAVDYLKKVAAANPALTDLVEIGKSRANTPIYVLVITNMKSGVPMDTLVPLANMRKPAVDNVPPMKPYDAKPGQWIDGGARGVDAAGAGTCLYIIDKLLAGYGNDADITRLVDENAFYICPMVNVDGYAGVAGAAKGPAVDAVAANFPEGWWKDDNTPGGTGEYPASTPEARAILEFFTNHTNILLVQSFDAVGGQRAVRPFARWPESRLDARDLAVFDNVIGKKYQELAGTPATWRTAYNTERQAASGHGLFLDWAYGQFGAFAMATAVTSADEKQYETAWQFERYKASLLPRVQIKEASARVLYTTNSASKATTSVAGDAVVVKKSGTPGRYRVVQVTATVENAGSLPTQVGRGTQLRGNRQDVIWLLGDRTKITFLEGSRWLPLGVLQGTIALPRAAAAEAGRGGRGAAPAGGGRGRGGAPGLALDEMREQRPEAPAARMAGSTRTVSWLVAVEGDTPLKLALTSQKGGTTIKDLAVQ